MAEEIGAIFAARAYPKNPAADSPLMRGEREYKLFGSPGFPYFPGIPTLRKGPGETWQKVKRDFWEGVKGKPYKWPKEEGEPEQIKPPPGKMVMHAMETAYNPEAQNMLDYILSKGNKPKFDDPAVKQRYYSTLEQIENGGDAHLEELYRKYGRSDGGRALLEELCDILRLKGVEVYPVDNSYFTEGLGEKPGHDDYRISGVNVKVRKGERVENTVLFDKKLKPYKAAAVIAHEFGGHSELEDKIGALTETGANAGGKTLLGYRALLEENPEYLIPLAELIKMEREDYRIPKELEKGIAAMNPWKKNQQFNPGMN